jgi:hypothetical protein
MDICKFTWTGSRWFADANNSCSQSGYVCESPQGSGTYIGEQTTTDCVMGG